MFQKFYKITKKYIIFFIFTKKILKNCFNDFNTDKIRNVSWAIKSAYNDFCDHVTLKTGVMVAKNSVLPSQE